MLVEKDFLSKLRDFGLNTYESKIWIALLSRGTSTAGELSDIANVPRSRSYDVLESLEKKGFIVMKLGKPITYMAVAPNEVVERIKAKLQEESQQQLSLIESIKQTPLLEELSTLHAKGIETLDETELTGCIRGRKNIYNHLQSMIKNAKRSIVITTTSEGASRKLDILGKSLLKAKQRGVMLRFGAPLEPQSGEAREFSKLGTYRKTKANARFCIIDRKEILFMLMDDTQVHPSYEAALWVNTEFFANTLEKSFLQHAGFV
ncbi:hypothetical protein HYU14_01225 [Candidatus Woesearchaeota archaeon]|nr:hypothetical protein [Candidatus Woesearchaeota archaeon]